MLFEKVTAPKTVLQLRMKIKATRLSNLDRMLLIPRSEVRRLDCRCFLSTSESGLARIHVVRIIMKSNHFSWLVAKLNWRVDRLQESAAKAGHTRQAWLLLYLVCRAVVLDFHGKCRADWTGPFFSA
jgi:hypothetical protein